MNRIDVTYLKQKKEKLVRYNIIYTYKFYKNFTQKYIFNIYANVQIIFNAKRE